MGSQKSKPMTKKQIEQVLNKLHKNIHKYSKSKQIKFQKNENNIKFLINANSASEEELNKKARISLRYQKYVNACKLTMDYVKKLVLNSEPLYESQKDKGKKKYSCVRKFVPLFLSAIYLTLKLRIPEVELFHAMIEQRFSSKFFELAENEISIEKPVRKYFKIYSY